MILGEEEEEKGVGMGACRRGRLVRRRSRRGWVSWLEELMWKGGEWWVRGGGRNVLGGSLGSFWWFSFLDVDLVVEAGFVAPVTF
jgi:hypothetical protein